MRNSISLLLTFGRALGTLGLLLGASGCGYAFQNSSSPLAEREGVRKIYIAPMQNNTYTPGIENIVYNALVQVISVHRRVTLVSHAEDADAVLKGVVSEADYVSTASNPAQTLTPNDIAGNPNFSGILIAQYYSATLGCLFSLERLNPSPVQKKLVWSAAFTRSRPFPASNQVGVPGTTSALINESEFDRALSDIANSMTGDIHESMLAMF